MREAKPWLASTGWLVVSILFANKLWIMDVTSMSLYWVARLPVERPKRQTSPRGSVSKLKRAASALALGRSRQWKLALSLAIVGALAAPFVFRTFKASPTYSVWVPLTVREKESLAASLRNSHFCQGIISVAEDFLCNQDKEKFKFGGDYQRQPDWPKYLALNLGTAVLAFISIAFLVPMLIRGVTFLARRYWKWLNA